MDMIEEFARDRQEGRKLEISVELFWYYLEVLPPVHMAYNATLSDGSTKRAEYGFAEGYEPVTAFWREGERCYAQLTLEVHHGS
jgi:hypothetical protein